MRVYVWFVPTCQTVHWPDRVSVRAVRRWTAKYERRRGRCGRLGRRGLVSAHRDGHDNNITIIYARRMFLNSAGPYFFLTSVRVPPDSSDGHVPLNSGTLGLCRLPLGLARQLLNFQISVRTPTSDRLSPISVTGERDHWTHPAPSSSSDHAAVSWKPPQWSCKSHCSIISLFIRVIVWFFSPQDNSGSGEPTFDMVQKSTVCVGDKKS